MTAAGNVQRKRVATPRAPQQSEPMNPMKRRNLESQSCWRRIIAGWKSHYKIDSGGKGSNDVPRIATKRQYTLEWKRDAKSSLPFLTCRQKTCWMCSRTTFTSDEHDADDNPSRFLGLNVNSAISSYIAWTFRTSYLLLFAFFGMAYFALIVGFSILYVLVAMKKPECITSAGVPIGSLPNSFLFSDCFHLSWTTFSTVGYGVVYPANGAEGYQVERICVQLGVLGSFEAFMGILYAGFCGAILFGKVLRSQNNAQVFFSDPIVIRFGKEELGGGAQKGGDVGDVGVERMSLEEQEVDGERSGEEEHKDEEFGRNWRDGATEGIGDSWECWENVHQKPVIDEEEGDNVPCPSLEFRLMNRLHDITNGEIVEAKLNCVAILDPKLCNRDVLDSVKQNDLSIQSSNHHDNENVTSSELAQVLKRNEAKNVVRSKGLAFHSSDSKQPRIFCKLSLDTEEHPFFRRVWFGRHRLDENSPLLTQHARDRVKQNGGHWPADMNDYKSIKRSLHFRHILVCISGTSNANAASVYAQKVYDIVDVNVGYRFVPMNYRTPDGELKTDSYLLNAVHEQRGGGAEPFR